MSLQPLRLVIDTSVTCGWFHAPQLTDYARLLLESMPTADFWVPSLWKLEMVNAFVQLARRNKITVVHRDAIIVQAMKLGFSEDSSSPDMQRILNLAHRHSLSAYDAHYLATALTLNAPLATQDAALTVAAQREGLWFDALSLRPP